MSEKFLISDIRISSKDDYKELSGLMNGNKLYFRVPKKFDLYPMAECFLGIGLLDAMASNSTIVIDKPISKVLYDCFNEIQSIYSCWNSDLNIVELEAEVSDEPAVFHSVGSFFSAGVDSSYTFLRNKEDISHLIMFRAFDSGNDDISWQQRVVKQTEFAESLGKSLIPVDTNVKEWTESRKISWEFVHGLFLSSIGGIFGMKRVYIPSSHTYAELFPWGSHPLSDPMWSTESTAVIHEGAGFRRGEKMRALLKEPMLANNLQVCWRGTGNNCGECSKCVRCMVAVKLLGGEIKSLPSFKEIKTLKILKATDEGGATMLEDAMVLAKSEGNIEIYKILKNYYGHYQIGLIWPLLDRYLFGNFIRSLYRKIKNPDWLNYRVTLRGGSKNKG